MEAHCDTGRRIYEVDYQGIFGNRHAKMVVDTSCDSPTARNFTVISQSGSKLLLKRVLLRLLDSEKEALQDTNQTRTALTPRNYSFRFLGIEQTPKETLYVLQVIPEGPQQVPLQREDLDRLSRFCCRADRG